MDILVGTVPTTYPTPKTISGFHGNRPSFLVMVNGYGSTSPFSAKMLRKSSVIVQAKKKNDKKSDNHSFVSKPDEATGVYPEAILLKQKKVQEDGRLLPEFADDDEEELFEFLNLQLESDLTDERMRHYEVVYLIHENHVEEVGKVNEKVEEFLREKKGRIWRVSDWGLRRLAYKIQKSNKAHYMLMNFELEAKWINDFKTLLDKDERVIRHLVIKRDKAIIENSPPPLEFHKMRAGMDGDGEEDDDFYDDEEDEDWDDEEEDGVILVNSDDDEETKSNNTSNSERRNLRAEKVAR